MLLPDAARAVKMQTRSGGNDYGAVFYSNKNSALASQAGSKISSRQKTFNNRNQFSGRLADRSNAQASFFC